MFNDTFLSYFIILSNSILLSAVNSERLVTSYSNDTQWN